MISQADIIRALVNKNCTDESIMSMALSPDCTPPKLLEKFNEAERFDLALDFSMKLGLDVSPIWKTWAMRCLKNRNFQGAREKFRHCFQRLRSTSGRGGYAGGNLISDILSELICMEEKKLPLSEQIDLIKNRDRGSLGRSVAINQSMESRPTIFAECLHYLREYGTVEDQIKFFIKTSLWRQAVEQLLTCRDKINADRFFIIEVVSKASLIGRLDEILDSFLEQDPSMRVAHKYYRAMYNYYQIHRRFNSLYYLQNKIGDFVAAAENLIQNFFLRKPTINYKELNARLPKLIDASDNYKCHIARLENVGSTKPEVAMQLFEDATVEQAKLRLDIINNQIDITRNFAINEVHGCMHHVQVVCNDECTHDDCDINSPITLFHAGKRERTYLAALILIYYDDECTAYFSTSGLNLANTLIQDYKLDKICVFKTAMRIIIEDESCDILDSANLLLNRLIEDHLAAHRKSKLSTPTKARRKSTKHVIIREVAHIAENDFSTSPKETKDTMQSSSSSQTMTDREPVNDQNQTNPPSCRPIRDGTQESARVICDNVIRDSIGSCQEPDYKMKLATLLSPEAKIELYIELGKLSNAQRLAFDMKRRDHVETVLREADRLNQDHIKDVCQHWLAKH